MIVYLFVLTVMTTWSVTVITEAHKMCQNTTENWDLRQKLKWARSAWQRSSSCLIFRSFAFKSL